VDHQDSQQFAEEYVVVMGALDAGLRPDPFPDRAGSLLPGILAAARTGLSPAGDDEQANEGPLHQDPAVLLGARNPEASGTDRNATVKARKATRRGPRLT